MDANKTPAAETRHRCPGCANRTASNRHELCASCVTRRPDDDEPTDVGYEEGDFA